MRKLGYIRTSTSEQLIDRQVMQLHDECDEVFIEDGVSAVKKHRPVYQRLMAELQTGDMFIVLSLDRVFRSVIDSLNELNKMQQRGIHFKSLSQNFDTTTPDGRFLYTIAAALAAWEREILSQRTKEGLQAARRRGKTLGRPRKLEAAQIEQARFLLETEVYSSMVQVAEHFRVHEKTIARAFKSETQ